MNKHALLKFFLVLFFLVNAFANRAYADTMLRKLSRGVTNIVTSPIELAVQPARVIVVEHQRTLAPTLGLFRGVYYTLGRITAGVYDIATFPIPLPFRYEPIFEPETVFQGIEALSEIRDWPFPKYGFGQTRKNQFYGG